MAKRKRSLRRSIRVLLLSKEPPERTALAFGFGVFLGFSPFIGFQILIAFAVILLLPVNRVAVFVGLVTNTPWTIAPAAALGTSLGFHVLGTDAVFPELSFQSITSGVFWDELTADVWHLLAPFVVGNLLLSMFLGAVAYWLLKFVLVRYRLRRRGDTVRTAAND